MRVVLKSILILAMLASAAGASPTIFGPTGLVTLPDADVLETGSTTANIAQSCVTDPSLPARQGTFLSFEKGFVDCIEAGAGFQAGDSSSWSVNLKYKTPITVGGFDWALGAIYQDFRPPRNDLRATQIYLAASHTYDDPRPLAPRMKLTLGLTQTELEGGPYPGKVQAMRGYAGMELLFKSGTSAVVEFETPNEDKFDEGEPLWSFGFKRPIGRDLMAQIGYTKWDLFLGNGGGQVYVALSRAR